jgi:hypothetical protein
MSEPASDADLKVYREWFRLRRNPPSDKIVFSIPNGNQSGQILDRLDGAEAILRQLARVEINANDELWGIRESARKWFQERKG